MRSIRLVFTVPGRSAQDVYATLANFEDYPRHSAAVRRVTVATCDAETSTSSWEVNFRNGILRWVEEDTFHAASHRFEFRQTVGDVEAFDGSWDCSAAGPDVTVAFAARIDLGIPSLAKALEPIAVRTLISNTIDIVTGLLGDRVRVDSVDDGAAASTRPAASAEQLGRVLSVRDDDLTIPLGVPTTSGR